MHTFPKLSSPAVLSPMSGVTDVTFRTLAKKYGAGLTYTEFVSSAGIVRSSSNYLKMVQTDPSEVPVAVQLFGNSVEEVVDAAKIVEDKFDIIDINCGCPAWKVVKSGAGSALLNNPVKIEQFVSNLVSKVNKPVTVKIRSGITEKSINAVEVAKVVENAGASAIAIHGRTQQQGYSGSADWSIIKQVKDAVNIPVIGNGDVFTPEQFKQRLEESGVDAIMIARGAVGNPYIFKQIHDYLKKGEYEKHTDAENKSKLFFEYLKIAEKYDVQFSTIKNHAISFTKGIIGGSEIREQLVKCKKTEEIVTIVNNQFYK